MPNDYVKAWTVIDLIEISLLRVLLVCSILMNRRLSSNKTVSHVSTLIDASKYIKRNKNGDFSEQQLELNLARVAAHLLHHLI